MNAATIKTDLPTRRDRMQQWWMALDNVKQLYVAGMITAGLFVATIVVSGIGLPADVLLMTAITVTATAFVIESYRWLVATFETPLAKWLTGVAGVMAAALATVAASSTLAVRLPTEREAHLRLLEFPICHQHSGQPASSAGHPEVLKSPEKSILVLPR